ncbi:MAG: hypothetical protein ACSHW7_08385 [Patiriisocius sp.]|uniref:hypothetical protein n=1 Tax=Patiriisocius sp. TaxID=2822396 RepID=UPI003EF67980
MNKLKLLLVFAIGLIFQQSIACTCAEESNSLKEKVAESFERGSYIFSGLVVNIEKENNSEIRSSFEEINYTFEVVKQYKGVPDTKTIKVKSYADSASCGYEFTLGQTYLVYANGLGDNISTTLCNRNNPIAGVEKKELKYLKKYYRKHKKK